MMPERANLEDLVAICVKSDAGCMSGLGHEAVMALETKAQLFWVPRWNQIKALLISCGYRVALLMLHVVRRLSGG